MLKFNYLIVSLCHNTPDRLWQKICISPDTEPIASTNHPILYYITQPNWTFFHAGALYNDMGGFIDKKEGEGSPKCQLGGRVQNSQNPVNLVYECPIFYTK